MSARTTAGMVTMKTKENASIVKMDVPNVLVKTNVTNAGTVCSTHKKQNHALMSAIKDFIQTMIVDGASSVLIIVSPAGI